ncbi:hypothetical protein FA95DRAFT_325915 [Auriscalpium vulgare]|uniref:Uncharacterized protein n=1 Tax=Auriscalpium vulgare TaxID=40419 RepID=A0ACB8RJE5_9AGAM|nr:hypothetical protein FA95DRAFT_325915 [Auriscalpium vulgare]
MLGTGWSTLHKMADVTESKSIRCTWARSGGQQRGKEKEKTNTVRSSAASAGVPRRARTMGYNYGRTSRRQN